MAVAVTITDQFDLQSRLGIIGFLTVSGNYTTGGDTVDFSLVKTSKKIPQFMSFEQSQGFGFEYDPVNNKVIVYRGGAGVSVPMAQLATATSYSSQGVTATIAFFAIFLRP